MSPTPSEYIAELNTLLQAQTEIIARDTTVTQSAVDLIATFRAANAALQARILELAIDPAVADQVRAAFAANNAAFDAQTTKLAAALVESTPSAPPA